jgi:hypothetical protein
VAVEIDPTTLALYVGEYQADASAITISLKSGTLMAKPSGEDAAELVPESVSAFYLPAFDARIEFVRDTSGAVSGLIVNMSGQEIPADKVK